MKKLLIIVFLGFYIFVNFGFSPGIVVDKGEKGKRFLVPENFIDYTTFPILDDYLDCVANFYNNDYVYIKMSHIDISEVPDDYILYEGDKLLHLKNYYIISVDYFYTPFEDQEVRSGHEELFDLVSRSNRFIKILGDYYPVVFNTEFDSDFYYNRLYNSYTGKPYTAFERHKNEKSVIVVGIFKNHITVLRKKSEWPDPNK